MSEWFNYGKGGCLMCSDNGFIPVLSFKSFVGSKIIAHEHLYSCVCKNKKLFPCVEEKKEYDSKGKKQSIEYKRNGLLSHFDVFTKTQFPFTQDMVDCVKGKRGFICDYYEIYQIYAYQCYKHNKIVNDISVFENYFNNSENIINIDKPKTLISEIIKTREQKEEEFYNGI